ncbi:hypothetical protein SteCoe_28073 [Stentor coeruleus]|uniref:Uncharacterized protein n=1 Tax=Stentor coeruleus TaxID=5963 RepID=A0A1R2B908_9CILI|nr:hypothetical protein SteCoe_28073 [Stentor coeruleus]
MSSNSSLIIDDDLDVDEGAVIKTVQSSIFELKNSSIQASDFDLSPSPIILEVTPTQSENPDFIQSKSRPSLKNDIIPEQISRIEFSVEDNQSIYDSKKETGPKNFLKKNIEITKKKKEDIKLNDIDINELILEDEDAKKTPVNVDERFYKYQDKVKAKVKTLAKELQEKEMEKCTFKPDVKSQGMKRRTTDQFLDQMKMYEKMKNDKIEMLRTHKNEINEEEAVHHPTINPRSKEILAKKGENHEPIYEKLYKSANKDKEKPEEKSPLKLTPSKSSTVRRAEPIEKVLYEDALRRASKLQIEVKPVVKEPQTSIKSHQVLAKKFTKEFQEVVLALSIQSETCTVEDATKMLLCLNFIRNNPEHPKYSEEKALVDRFFKTINANEEVLLKNMLKMSLAVMNIYIPSLTTEIDDQENPENSQVAGLSMTKDDVLKIHKQFNVFYENRQLSNQVVKNIQQEEYPFKPQLTPGTEALAKEVQKRAGSLCSVKREAFVQREKQKTQEKNEKLKKEKEEREAQFCTFKPSLLTKSTSKPETSDKNRSLALYEQSKELKEKKAQKIKSINELELEKNLSECTFTPKLEKVKVKEDRDILNSKSVQQQLMRMQKAREEQERKKKILEGSVKGSTMSTGIDYSHKSKSSFKPPLSGGQRSPLKSSQVGDFFADFNTKTTATMDSLDKQTELDEVINRAMNHGKKKVVILDEDEEIQLEVKMPDGSNKTLIIPPGADKELKISMFILENRLNEDLGRKLRASLLSL